MIPPNRSKVYRAIKDLQPLRKPPAVIYEWDIAHHTGISRRRVKWVCRILYWTGWIQGSRDMTRKPLGNIVRIT